jgi:outer membrane protein TolC
MPFLLLSFVALTGQVAQAATWENFVTLSLKKSPQIQQVRYQYQVPDLSYLLTLQNLDWKATLASGSERDRTETTTKQTFHLDETQTNSLSLAKSFITGTDATLTASTEAIRSRSVLFSGTEAMQSNSYLLTLEQNLWRNAFGSGIREQLNAARKDADIQALEKKEALETALLQGGQLFWQAAIMERRYKESEAVLKSYETLVKSVEKKNRVRYAAPGEYAQAQAQYFARQQQARINKVNYEQAVSDLKLFLPDLKEDDLKWNEDEPKYKSMVLSTKADLNQTRSQRLAQLKKDKAELTADSVENLNRSQFALVGQVGATGVDPSNTVAQKEWLEGRRPSLYIGVKWSQTFGSGARDAQNRSAKSLALAQDLATQTETQRLITKAELLTEEISSLEDNLKSQDNQLKALRQAVQELNRNYTQGRIDINVLIDLINQAETAEASSVEARANLELKYLEWEFLFDRIAVD